MEFLTLNSALLVPAGESGVTVQFIDDASGVFDRLSFSNQEEAEAALLRNDLDHYAEHQEPRSFLRPPSPPFHEAEHQNGPSYSSGQFWQ